MISDHSLSKMSVILLAGGIGSRMNNPTPKQFLSLNNKTIARYSFDIFLSMPETKTLVVVCDPNYRHLFHFENNEHSHRILFANPGERRQDSVFNGFQALNLQEGLICIHDAARPFITTRMVRRVMQAAEEHGAATSGMPVKFTVKECDPHGFVTRTLPRAQTWEIQTPQVMQFALLQKGFAHAHQEKITVTDDVSLAELIEHPVKLIEGAYNNLKITTPEDFLLAERILKQDITYLS